VLTRIKGPVRDVLHRTGLLEKPRRPSRLRHAQPRVPRPRQKLLRNSKKTKTLRKKGSDPFSKGLTLRKRGLTPF
jgi:hypothetical protein